MQNGSFLFFFLIVETHKWVIVKFAVYPEVVQQLFPEKRVDLLVDLLNWAHQQFELGFRHSAYGFEEVKYFCYPNFVLFS